MNNKRNVLLVLLIIGIAALACSGTPAAMQIQDQPIYVCPTATPRPTDTPQPTSLQPPVVVPPSGWGTYTPVPGCIWNGFVCATNTPYPGGGYTTPGYIVPGATSTPRSTTTPYPTPTPFVMRPPDEFYIGDAVYTGGFISPNSARLRLLNIQTIAVSPASGDPRSIVVWQVEVKNTGASMDAVSEAGLSIVLDTITLAPGETQTFTLAAYIPAGTPKRFTWALDPSTRPTPATLGVPGSNLLIWTNAVNTVCAGDLSEPAVLPTPVS